MCLFLTGPSCEDSWVGSAQGQDRAFACASAGNNTAVWLVGLKWRVGQPNKTSDFHFSPCVPLQPSSTSQRDRHGFPRSPCGSTRHGMLSSALGWKQARMGLSERHRACVAKQHSFFFARKGSMTGSEGLRGRRHRLDLLKNQRCRSVCRYTKCAPKPTPPTCRAGARSTQAGWTLPHT